MIKLKNVFDTPSEADGKRILITRLWPLDVDTYVSKIDFWLKDLAPAYSILEWFREHPKDWDGFRERYLNELEDPKIKKILKELFEQGQKEDITLLYTNEIPDKSPAGIIYQMIGSGVKSNGKNWKSGNRTQIMSCLLFLFCLLILGCSTSQDYNPSMDYNPGWEDDRNTVTSFDQLPRHKNRLEHGIH